MPPISVHLIHENIDLYKGTILHGQQLFLWIFIK